MNQSAPLLEARNVARRSPETDDWLLRDVCVEVHAGARVMIVGPAGSGKTLLLRALARLDPIDAGQVLWQGEPIVGHDVPRFRHQALYFHQRPALLEGTVEENLRAPLGLKLHRHREFRRDDVLSQLQLLNRDVAFLSRSSRDLSGGEAQIVALIRGIQLQPTLLLLDEPTAALDEESKRLIEALVVNWFEESPSQRALLWVSHDTGQVERVGQRVIRMANGALHPDTLTAETREEEGK